MDVWTELATLVRMAEEIGDDGDARTDDLDGDVPARADDLAIASWVRVDFYGFFFFPPPSLFLSGAYPKNHSKREHDAKRESHQQDMYP